MPTLRRELVASLALVFAGALLVAALGVIIVLNRVGTTTGAAAYLFVLITADVAVFAAFGRYLIERRVLAPIERVIGEVEAIARGDYDHRVTSDETSELARLAGAVNEMAERLIAHRQALAANVRSLERTNRELTETRDELVHAEKMASVGRLAAGIAHEIGNPLAAILGYVTLLGRGDEQRRQLAGAAETEARRIDRIVRGLLDYARPRNAHPHAIAVNEVVDSALELLESQGRFAGVRILRRVTESLPPVIADPHKLEQVMVNLLLNATDALEGRPEPVLVIRTGESIHLPKPVIPSRRRDDPPDVDYSHRRRFHQARRIPRKDPFPAGGRVVELEVSDNGSGIPPELIDEIFEPFVTTKEPGKGTGLGLAVAAGLVDAMGGTIRVDSPEGRGTSFTVVLPAAPDDSDQVEEARTDALAGARRAGERGEA